MGTKAEGRMKNAEKGTSNAEHPTCLVETIDIFIGLKRSTDLHLPLRHEVGERAGVRWCSGNRGRSLFSTKHLQHPIGRSSNEQFHGGKDGEGEDHDFEGGLVHALEDDRAEQRAGNHRQAQDGVEFQGISGDEAEVRAEGDFEEVDDEKKPGAGADERKLWQADGEEVDDHERTGGVGGHGGEAGEDAREGDEPPRVRQARGEVAGAALAPELQGDHDDEDDGDGAFGLGVVEFAEREAAEHDAERDPGKQFPEMRPFGVFPKNADAKKIGADEEREQGADGITRGQGVGKERHAQDAESGETGLGHAHEKRGGGEQGPLPGGQVHGRMVPVLKWRKNKFPERGTSNIEHRTPNAEHRRSVVTNARMGHL